ncbi:MAG TPA: HNH endonuclease, partial [Protaetiibacter sp.]|nr:HNH endonuclease [Protaetiibacter sp.]
MDSIAVALETVGDDLAGVVEAAFADDGLRLRDDHEVLAALAAAARLQRAAEALMSEAVAQVLERD